MVIEIELIEIASFFFFFVYDVVISSRGEFQPSDDPGVYLALSSRSGLLLLDAVITQLAIRQFICRHLQS